MDVAEAEGSRRTPPRSDGDVGGHALGARARPDAGAFRGSFTPRRSAIAQVSPFCRRSSLPPSSNIALRRTGLGWVLGARRQPCDHNDANGIRFGFPRGCSAVLRVLPVLRGSMLVPSAFEPPRFAEESAWGRGTEFRITKSSDQPSTGARQPLGPAPRTKGVSDRHG